MDRDSLVGIATRYGEVKKFSFLHVRPGLPWVPLNGYGGFLLGLEWPERKVDHPSPFSADPHTCITPCSCHLTVQNKIYNTDVSGQLQAPSILPYRKKAPFTRYLWGSPRAV